MKINDGDGDEIELFWLIWLYMEMLIMVDLNIGWLSDEGWGLSNEGWGLSGEGWGLSGEGWVVRVEWWG